MSVSIAIPDLISPSYFPAIAAVELGCCRAEGIDAEVKLVFPVERAYRQLEAAEVDYVGAASHSALVVFDGWRGARLLAALSQGMYWFLVVATSVTAERGDLAAVRGLRIGAAPGPVDGLRAVLRMAGVDPDTDVAIGPVPGVEGAGVSFGVTAAQALAAGAIDGFWANGMGAEVALRSGTGRLLVDARRGDVPPEAVDMTFPALVTTEAVADRDPDQMAAMVRAVVSAQQMLVEDPARAVSAASRHFPAAERDIIAELIARDREFYQAHVGPPQLEAVNRFAAELGLLRNDPLPFDEVVPALAREQWQP